MHIAIDASCWTNRRGFGRYTRELVPRIIEQGSQHRFTLLVDRPTADESRFPPGARLAIVDTRRQATEAASAYGSRSPLDVWRMGQAAARLRPDLFFFPAVYSFFPIPRRIPMVVTFHDAIAETHPRLIFPTRRGRWLWELKVRLALRQATLVLTVSDSARTEIASAFDYPESKIRVVAEGPGAEFRPLEDPERIRRARERYGLPLEDPLILYVGGISPHKNLEGLLRALARLGPTPPRGWHLAVVGDYAGDSFYGCYPVLSRLCRRLELTERVTFTSYVPDHDLVALYNAGCFLELPSFDEGFGLPAVEAMACGLPVAASRRGSLPELLGPAGMLFDPEEPGEMDATLARLLESSDLRAHLRGLGLDRVKRFSWQSAARETIRIFEETGGERVGTS